MKTTTIKNYEFHNQGELRSLYHVGKWGMLKLFSSMIAEQEKDNLALTPVNVSTFMQKTVMVGDEEYNLVWKSDY